MKKSILYTTILMAIILLFIGIGYYIGLEKTSVNTSIENPILTIDDWSNYDRVELISKVDTDDKVLTLSFQGLSDIDTNRRILKILAKYNQKLDFFIPGILVAEDSNFVKELYLHKHRIGSNTLLARKNMQELSQDELIDDFIRTDIIFKNILKESPKTLLYNSSIHTDKLLKIAKASGYTHLIKPDKYLNYQSFKEYKQVVNYIKGLERGSIITIKMDGVLDEFEYEKSIKTDRPAIDKQAGLGEKKEDEKELSPEDSLVNLVEWILKAIEEADYKLVFAQDLKNYERSDPPIKYVDNKHKYTNKLGQNNKITNMSKRNFNQGFIKETDEEKNDKIEFDKYIDRKVMDKLRKKNKGKKAREYRTIPTTEKALSYTFYGIENTEVLPKVLDSLDIMDARATFFVSIKDIEYRSDIIKEIGNRGHEIGLSLIESQDRDFYTTLSNILFMQKEIEKIRGRIPDLVRYPYDLELNDEILEAISTANARVIWEDIAIASSKVGADGDLASVMKNAFNEGNITVRRGYIIYYRMDYYKDPNLISDVMMKIKKDRVDTVAYDDEVVDNKSFYTIKSLGEVLRGSKVYNYPVRDEDLLASIKDIIHPGYLSSYGEAEKFDFIKSRYVGNPDVNKYNTLPGFTDEELEEVDKTGIFTHDRVLFLTFDDWSSDKPINQLLYVLDKHKVKASFFIRTNYMESNPNILRAIAEEGHDVGSHSDNHLPFAIREGRKDLDEDDTTSLYYSLNEEGIRIRREDLKKSYDKLQAVIGDIYVDNRPALNTIFRPPTLAMSRIGMETIFDMGFSHIVSGDFSTHDYEDRSPDSLVEKLVNQMVTEGGDIRTLKNGSILVMHMSDFKENSIYQKNVTAEALDMAIPILKSKGYTFARLSDYLYGK